MKHIPLCGVMRVLTIFCLLTVCRPAHPYDMPPFWPEGCTWNATDIIVATEGAKIDGVLTVEEVWKGDLKPGQQIMIPELASFSPAARRLLFSTDQQATYAADQRMVLFLQHRRAKDDGDKWLSANDYFGGNLTAIMNSMVWVEQEHVYQIGQLMNPGSPILLQSDLTEAKIRDTTKSVLAAKKAFYQVIAMPDKGWRAQALVPFTRSMNRDETAAAWRALGACGPAALPTLRVMLHKTYLPPNYDDILTALSRVEGMNAEPYLIHVLREEAVFWTGHEQDLSPGWWRIVGSGDRTRNPKMNYLLDHYDKASLALEELRFINATRCRAAVRVYRNFWLTHASHHNRSGLENMLQCCANILDPPLP